MLAFSLLTVWVFNKRCVPFLIIVCCDILTFSFSCTCQSWSCDSSPWVVGRMTGTLRLGSPGATSLPATTTNSGTILVQSCHNHPTLVQPWYPATTAQLSDGQSAFPGLENTPQVLLVSLLSSKRVSPTLPQPAGIPIEGVEIGLANGYRGPMLLTGVAVSLE